MKHAEHIEQCLLIKLAAIYAASDPRWDLLFAIPNAGGYTGGFKQNMLRVMKMKAEGLKSGVPDLFLPVSANSFHGLFIEMKAGKNKTTPKQNCFIEKLISQGYKVVVCYSCTEAVNVIKNYFKKENYATQEKNKKAN